MKSKNQYYFYTLFEKKVKRYFSKNGLFLCLLCNSDN